MWQFSKTSVCSIYFVRKAQWSLLWCTLTCMHITFWAHNTKMTLFCIYMCVHFTRNFRNVHSNKNSQIKHNQNLTNKIQTQTQENPKHSSFIFHTSFMCASWFTNNAASKNIRRQFSLYQKSCTWYFSQINFVSDHLAITAKFRLLEFMIEFIYTYAPIHTLLIVSVTLTMISSGNKVKSWPGFFEIYDDTITWQLVLVNW